MNLSQLEQQTSHWAIKTFKEADLIVRGEATRIVLDDACKDVECAEILILTAREVVPVHFLRLTEDALVLELKNADLGLKTDEMLAVSFTHNERLHQFMVPLLRVTDSSKPGFQQMELVIPSEIHSSQVRRSFRIPTAGCLDLDAEIEIDGDFCKTVILDISLGGLRADIYAGPDLRVEPGQRAQIRFAFKGIEVAREVEIRKIRKSMVHASFVKDEEAERRGTDIDFMNLLIALGEDWQGA